MDVSGNEFLAHVIAVSLDIDNVLDVAKSLALKVKGRKDLKLNEKIELVQKTLRAALNAQKDVDPTVITAVTSMIDNVVPHTVIVATANRWCVQSWSLCNGKAEAEAEAEAKDVQPVDAMQKKEEVSTPALTPATSEQV